MKPRHNSDASMVVLIAIELAAFVAYIAWRLS